MIIEYHRPETMEQAKKLLSRSKPLTIPLGGGTLVSHPSQDPVAVVDLQALGLDKIINDESIIKIGSMVRLQSLVESSILPEGLSHSARRETNINIRRAATIGGLMMTAGGNSPLLGCFLSLDARLYWEPGDKFIYLSEWIGKNREQKPGKLITSIEFTLPERILYEDIARSAEDRPIVYVVASIWKTQETRVVVGGAGKYPVVASDSSNNLFTKFFDRHAISSILDRSGYDAYQQAAIQTLIDRITPHKSMFGRKGDE